MRDPFLIPEGLPAHAPRVPVVAWGRDHTLRVLARAFARAVADAFTPRASADRERLWS